MVTRPPCQFLTAAPKPDKAKRLATPDARKELITVVENTSRRECEKALIQLSPSFAKTVTDRIKAIRAHVNPAMSYAEVIEFMADLTLNKIDPEKKAAQANGNGALRLRQAKSAETTPTTRHTPRSRYIPAPIRHAVIARDGWRCTYVDPVSGNRCGSEFGLEFEHLTPFAMGGAHSIENLTLRCRCHNAWAAEQVFGRSSQVFWGSPQAMGAQSRK